MSSAFPFLFQKPTREVVCRSATPTHLRAPRRGGYERCQSTGALLKAETRRRARNGRAKTSHVSEGFFTIKVSDTLGGLCCTPPRVPSRAVLLARLSVRFPPASLGPCAVLPLTGAARVRCGEPLAEPRARLRLRACTFFLRVATAAVGRAYAARALGVRGALGARPPPARTVFGAQPSAPLQSRPRHAFPPAGMVCVRYFAVAARGSDRGVVRFSFCAYFPAHSPPRR